MEEAQNLVNPFTWIAWILSLPLRAVAWTINTVRARRYDPEKDVCPGCGFRGDSGTNKKTCTIRTVRTDSEDRAMIRHDCLRCGVDFYTKTFLPPAKWMAPESEVRMLQIKKAATRTTL